MGRRLIALGVAIGVAGVPVAFWPAGFNAYGPIKVCTLTAACVVVLAGIALDAAGRNRLGGLRSWHPAWLLLAMWFLGGLSILVCADPRTAIVGSYPGYESGSLTMLAAACIGLGVAALGVDGVRTLARALVVATVIVGAVAVFEANGASPVVVREYLDASRVRSTLGNAANLGLWCAAALPWVLSAGMREKRALWRIAAWAATALGVAALVLSRSRGALVAAAAAALVWTVLSWASGRRREGALGALATGLVAVALALTSVSRAATGSVDTVGGRLDVWRTTLRMIAERPFLGWGPGGFGRAFLARMPAALVDTAGVERTLEDPHNIVLSVAVALGPLAAIALGAFAILLSLEVWRTRGSEAGSAHTAAAASLAALAAGLQFHFLTADTATLAFAAVATVWVIAAGSRSEDAKAPVARGVFAVATGMAVVALVAALGLVAADTRLASGFDAASESGWAEARQAFEQAERYAPWEAATWWAEGRAARDGLRSDRRALTEGLSALDRANAIRPGDARIVRDEGDLYAIAALLERSGDSSADLFGQALQRYDAALELAPRDPLALTGRGASLLALGRFREAVDALETATDLAPRYAPAWSNLAEARRALGDAAGAQEAFDRAAELNQ